MRPLRVLHVIPSLALRYGGPPRACLELCRELARHGERMTIYTTDIDGPGRLPVPLGGRLSEDGVEIRYFPVQAPRGYVMSRPLARALKQAVPVQDLVHIHGLYRFPSTAAAHYCRRARVPYLVRPHGILDPFHFRHHRGRKWLYERLFEWRTLNRAAAIHFTTSEEARLAAPLGLAPPAVVASLGVHPEDRHDEPRGGAEATLAALWPETQGRQVLLFLGRLHAKKGLDLLATAFGRLARTRPDVHLLVAGPDDEGYGAAVRRWLAAEGVLDRCTFTGMLLGARKRAALRGAQVFVLPSYSENFGMAVVEALAAGLPVIISDRVNIWREVAAAGAGLVVGCDADGLHRALACAIADPAGRAAMGTRARHLAAARFSWTAAGQRMVEVYRDLIHQRPGEASASAARREVRTCE